MDTSEEAAGELDGQLYAVSLFGRGDVETTVPDLTADLAQRIVDAWKDTVRSSATAEPVFTITGGGRTTCLDLRHFWAVEVAEDPSTTTHDPCDGGR